MLNALQPFGPIPKTKTQKKREALIYGNEISQAYKSTTKLPIENRISNFGVSKSFDLGAREFYNDFTAEMQRLHPEIPPPRPADRLKRAIPLVSAPKFLRDNISVTDIDGATPK